MVLLPPHRRAQADGAPEEFWEVYYRWVPDHAGTAPPTDYLVLYKLDHDWRIVTKTFVSR